MDHQHHAAMHDHMPADSSAPKLMNMGDMDMDMMSPYFVLSRSAWVLFEDFAIYTTGDWLLAFLTILGFCLCREALSVYRSHRSLQLRLKRKLQHAARKKALSQQQATSSSSSSSAYTHVFHPAAFQLSQPLLQPQNTPVNALASNEKSFATSSQSFSCILYTQLIDSFYYLLTLVFGYLLMLIVMSYNVGLCLLVVFTCAGSHFVCHVAYSYYLTKLQHTLDASSPMAALDVALLQPTPGDHCCPEIEE